MTKPTDLHKLAKLRYGEPSSLEQYILGALHNGETADCGQKGTVSARFLRWLCADADVPDLMDQHATHSQQCRPDSALRISRAHISGEVNLANVDINVPLFLRDCDLPDGIDLIDATSRLIDLAGSTTGRIKADRLRVRSSLLLRDGFHAKGGVLLPGAVIAGNLSCRRGIFEQQENSTGARTKKGCMSLLLDNVDIRGNLLLNDDFLSCGTVSAVGAVVKGIFRCTRGRFNNPEGDALIGTRITVRDNVYLDDGFHAKGGVKFSGAHIGGHLVCRGGTVTRRIIGVSAARTKGGAMSGIRIQKQVHSIVLDAATIGGSAYCNAVRKKDGSMTPFMTDGVVRLVGATIAGDLIFNYSKFVGDMRVEDGNDVVGLEADHMTVKGEFTWVNITHEDLRKELVLSLGLSHARVGAFKDDQHSFPDKGYLNLDGFVYDSLRDAPVTFDVREEWLKRQLSHKIRDHDLSEVRSFISQLQHDARALSKILHKQLAIEIEDYLNCIRTPTCPVAEGVRSRKDIEDEVALTQPILDKLNDVLEREDFYYLVPRKGIRLRITKRLMLPYVTAKAWIDQKLQRRSGSYPRQSGTARNHERRLDPREFQLRVNRLALEHAYLNEILGSFRPQPYEQLAVVLRRVGSWQAAAQVLMWKEEVRALYADWTVWTRLAHYLYGRLSGFGHKAERAFFWSMGLVVRVRFLGKAHGPDERTRLYKCKP